LLRAIAPAKCWFEEPASGNAASLVEIARRERLPKRYVARLIRLDFILPAVAEAITRVGPLGINLQMLMDGRCAVPFNWQDQQAML
jgi:hypothetical protein